MNCVNPCTPSVSAVGVVTRRMLAAGAVACAHSTSSDTSRAQPLRASRPVPLLGGGGTGAGDPCTFRTLNHGRAARLGSAVCRHARPGATPGHCESGAHRDECKQKCQPSAHAKYLALIG